MRYIKLLAICFLVAQCTTFYKIRTDNCEVLGNKQIKKLVEEYECFTHSKPYLIPSLGGNSAGLTLICKEEAISFVLVDVSESTAAIDVIAKHPTVNKVGECYVEVSDVILKFKAVWFPLAYKEANEDKGGEDNAG